MYARICVAFCLTALSSISSDPEALGFASEEPAEATSVEKLIKLSIKDLSDDDTLSAGTERVLRILVDPASPEKTPRKYRITFIRSSDQAQAGQFPGDLDRTVGASGDLHCDIKVKVPSKPGDYSLKVEAVPLRSAAPSPEEKAGMEYRIKVKA